MGDPNLVTTCNFHGEEYLFKMNVLNNNLEILITDKSSGEEWQCSYDATYIENLTHKTGNFKQFDIFIAMIKSGLLRTSESVTLDLLTFEDLELLRSRKITKAVGPNNNNRRYLIVTYVVEFDKIRYPLPLEYCGPPDPIILQGTIKRLELELSKAREELALKANNNESRKIYFLQKRVDELTEENVRLQEENRRLEKLIEKKPKSQMVFLQNAVHNLEKSVLSERNSHHELVEKLKTDKLQLTKELEKLKSSEKCLKVKLNKAVSQMSSRAGFGDCNRALSKKTSNESLKTMYRKGEKYHQATDLEFDGHNSTGRSVNKLLRKKSNQSWDGVERPKFSKTTVRKPRSRSSSASSAKYVDPQVCPEDFARTPQTSTPRRSRSHTSCRSRNTSTDTRSSSRGSSKASPSRHKIGQDLDYKKLEQKIATLQKMIKKQCKK